MFLKWSIVLTMVASSTLIHANPYKAPRPPPPMVLDTITALKVDLSADIEKIPAPPSMHPPKDPYEGGSQIQLNVKEEEPMPNPPAPSYPPPSPPSSYSPPMTYHIAKMLSAPPSSYPDPPEYPEYSTKPEGYGPKQYKTPNYYKLPSSDIPYYETTSKKKHRFSSSKRKPTYLPPQDSETMYQAPPAPSSSSSSSEEERDRPVEAPNYYYASSPESTTHETQKPRGVTPDEEALFFNAPPNGRAQASRGPVVHRVIYLPADSTEEAAANRPWANHDEQSNAHAPSGIPYYETSSNSESSKDLYEHKPVASYAPDSESRDSERHSYTTHYHHHKTIKDSSPRSHKSRDSYVSRHQNGGTIINIPSASRQVRSKANPEPAYINIKREGRRIKRSINNHHGDSPQKSQRSWQINEPVKLRKITKMHKPMFKYVNVQRNAKPTIRNIVDKPQETQNKPLITTKTYMTDLQVLPILDFGKVKMLPLYQNNNNVNSNNVYQAGLENQMANSLKMLYPNDALQYLL